MAYLGNSPALSYTSFAKQDFTTSATTSYTLDHPVTNENEIALFINFVRQEPTTAYTASGTSLTLTSATSSSDDMYCVFLGKAVQTVNPPNGSVGTSQLADSSVSLAKLSATGTKDSTTFLRGDNTFASAGGTNTPAFQAYLSSNQTISGSTWTKVQFNTEIYDTDSNYDNSTNYRFTPTTAGKYFCYYLVGSSWTGSTGGSDVRGKFQKNGSDITGYVDSKFQDFGDGAGLEFVGTSASGYAVINFNGSSDYLEVYHRSAASTPFITGASYFGAYKIIE